MKTMPTKRNIVFFGIAFQIYPLLLWALTTLVNPNPKIEGVVGIFAIAQIVLVSLIFTWKRKATVEVHDEREALVQLKRGFLSWNACVARDGNSDCHHVDHRANWLSDLSFGWLISRQNPSVQLNSASYSSGSRIRLTVPRIQCLRMAIPCHHIRTLATCWIH